MEHNAGSASAEVQQLEKKHLFGDYMRLCYRTFEDYISFSKVEYLVP